MRSNKIVRIWSVVLTAAIGFCICAASGRAAGGLDSLQKLLKTQLPDSSRVNVMCKAIMELYLTYPDSAVRYGNAAVELGERCGYQKGLALAYNNLGNAYYAQGLYQIALRSYLQALRIRETIGDSVGIAGTLNNLGLVYKEQNKLEQALDNYRRALQMNVRLSNKLFMARVLNNIAIIYEEQNKDDSALAASRQSINIKQTIGNKAGIAPSINTIAKVFAKRGLFKEAVDTLQAAIPLAREGRSMFDLARIYVILGSIYQQQHRLSEAQKAYTGALQTAQKAKARLLMRDAYKGLSDVAIQQNDYYTGYKEFYNYAAVNDSLFNESERRAVAELPMMYEVGKKELQIRLLEENLRNRERITQLLAVAVMAAVAVVVLFVVLYVTKKKSAQEILRQQSILEEQSRDIELANSRLQNLNQTLEFRNTELVALNAEKNEFLGIAAHDLKNPLSNIMGMTEMLRWDEEMALENRQNFLDVITASSERMLTLIQNLLDTNRIEQGAVKVNPVPMNVVETASLVVEDHRSHAAQKNITLHYTAPAPLFVVADEQATMQVLDNIVSNAVKYSLHGKNVFVRVQSSTDAVRLEVQDEGPGISTEDQQKLFGKFARLTAKPTGGEHSTGLGLSIVKKLAEAMNGRVWCESVFGKGSTFILELPAAPTTNTKPSTTNTEW